MTPLDESEVVECASCHQLTRHERSLAEIDAFREYEALADSLRGGSLTNEKLIWQHPRVRAVLAGPFGAQCELMIRDHFKPTADGGRSTNALE